MSLLNQNWQTFGGEPVTGMTPTRLIVYTDSPGLIMNAQQEGFVAHAYKLFCDAINVSPHREGFHLQNRIASDGTKVRMESIGGIHKVQVWISGSKVLNEEEAFYWGYIERENPAATHPTQKDRWPFVIDKKVTKLRPLTSGYLPLATNLYVAGADYYWSTQDDVNSVSSESVPYRTGTPGDPTPVTVQTGSQGTEWSYYKNDTPIESGSALNTKSWRRDPDGYALIRADLEQTGVQTFSGIDYPRGIFYYTMRDVSWFEQDALSLATVGSGGEVFQFGRKVYDLKGKKIFEVANHENWDDFPPPSVPAWYTTSVFVNMGRSLRNGFYYRNSTVSASTEGEVWGNYYQWTTAESTRVSTGIGTSLSGQPRPIIFRPLEMGPGTITYAGNRIFKDVVQPSASMIWGAIPAYDQTLHGWRNSAASPRHLALTRMQVGPAFRTTTIEALLEGAGLDPALAGNTYIMGLNMAAVDPKEPTLYLP